MHPELYKDKEAALAAAETANSSVSAPVAEAAATEENATTSAVLEITTTTEATTAASEEQTKRRKKKRDKGAQAEPPPRPLVEPVFPTWSIAKFEAFLDQGPAAGLTAQVLLVAFQHFHFRFLDMALDRGLNINMRLDGHLNTLLHMAIKQGDVERLEYLLARGANVNLSDHKGESCLHMCLGRPVEYHPLCIASALIAKGADINAQNDRGVTVLHRACLFGALEYVELFLQNRAKVFVFDHSGKLAIQYAGHFEREIRLLFNQNVRYCGKKEHQRLWAHIMSRQFMTSIFSVVAPSCVVCRRKQHECDALKKRNFRYWLYSHELSKSREKR